MFESMFDRRQVLRLATALGLAPLASFAAGCGDVGGGGGPDDDYDGPPGPEDLFGHGVASGDPLPDAVILWTRLSPAAGSGAIRAFFEIASDPDLRDRVSSGFVETTAERDWTVKLDATGLAAGTTYFYRFRALGRSSPIGRTRTAPAGPVERLRFGVVSCSSLAHGYFHAYRLLAARSDVDAVLHLGDYIYEYATGEYGSVRAYEPANETVSLADYRTRHAQYRRDPDLQEVHRQHPFVAVWDDHESADNAWNGGAENHQEAEGSWQDRKQAAQRAYDEWMPTRTTSPERLFRSLRFGDLVHLSMLDTRLFGRDRQANGVLDPAIREEGRTLLGEEQEAWLGEQLRTSSARWNLLGQQVMMAPLKLDGAPNVLGGGTIANPDQWDGYFATRARLFGTIRDAGVEGVVVLSGDIHSSWGSDLADDPNDPAAYDPASGAGAVGVELVCPGVSSPGFEPALAALLLAQGRSENPHIKYAELTLRGYLLVTVTRDRLQGAWFHLDGVTDPSGALETLGASWSTEWGTNHLVDDRGSFEEGSPRPLAP
jgi:alkaline phosphatase D